MGQVYDGANREGQVRVVPAGGSDHGGGQVKPLDPAASIGQVSGYASRATAGIEDWTAVGLHGGGEVVEHR